MYISLDRTIGAHPVGPEGDMRCRGVLSVIVNLPEMHIPPGIGLGCPAPEDSNYKNYWQNLRSTWNPVEVSTGVHTALFSITTTAWGAERIISSRKVKRPLISALMEFFPASKAAKMIAPFGNPSL